jgi:rhodanese-related sulfurtransferase
LLDVGDPDEFEEGHIAGALNIPLNDLRARLGELSRDKELWVYCRSGLRGYNAVRLLVQHGFPAKNLSGGFLTYQALSATQPS